MRALIQNPIADLGDWVSLDGDTGAVTLGKRVIVSDLPAEEMAALAAWRGAVAMPAAGAA
jgi:hypothetical protein